MNNQNCNISYLRKQIIASSPELRELEAQLQRCSILKENKAALAEKQANATIRQIEEENYAKLVKCFSEEERLSLAIDEEMRLAKALEIHRGREEQIAERVLKKSEANAENVVEALSAVDEMKKLEAENEEYRRKKEESLELTRKSLETQTYLKMLHKHEEDIEQRLISQEAEEFNKKTVLQEEVSRHQREIERLHQNRLEHAMVKKLEDQQQHLDELRNLREEKEVMEQEYKEKIEEEDRIRHREEARKELIWHQNQQLRLKQEQLEREKKNEEEYIKILLEVQAEESRLDQLVAAAKKRRQRDHRILADRLLEERRVLRATLRERQLKEDQELADYDKFRQQVIAEEERELLLQHAPHLLPYLTPQLLARLNQLQ